MSIEIERYRPTLKKPKTDEREQIKSILYIYKQSDATSCKDYILDVLAHNKEKAIASQQNRFAC